MKLLCILVFFLNSVLFSFAETEKGKQALDSSDKSPLVLQWKVSHPRNRDQISLVFKEKSVELVTNTSSYQKDKVARLGRFESPLSPELKTLKEKVNRYYLHLKKTVPVSSLIKVPQLQATVVDPHAPVLHINEEVIYNEQTSFKPLAKIIYNIWEHKWICIECALYKKEKKSIVRIVKKRSLHIETAVKTQDSDNTTEQWETHKKILSRKLLSCIPKGKDKVECVDPQFGIFAI